MVVIAGYLILILTCSLHAQNWPQWRGPLGTGVVPSGNPPVEWSEEHNVRWKIRLSGTGYSTPVIWGNNIFVSAAIPSETSTLSGRRVTPGKPVKFIVMAVDRTNGKVLWGRLAREAVPHEGRFETSAYATGSPITDGKYVYAFFGSRGLYCYDTEGNLIWEKDFGDKHTKNDVGEGSSPALYKNRLIVNWDHEKQSFITVLDAATGKEIWKKNRDEVTSWVTPFVVEVAGKVQVIIPATNKVLSYDLSNGDVIWEDEGLSDNTIPTPVAAGGVVYITGGLDCNAMRAIRLAGAKGNINRTPNVLWSYNRDTPFIPSPLLYKGLLYFLKSDRGILTCLNAATGQPHYSNQRLDGIREIYASPVGIQDRVYILGRDGVTLVLRNSSEFDVIAKNTLKDTFDASPVIIGDEIFLRGHKYLYCIGR